MEGAHQGGRRELGGAAPLGDARGVGWEGHGAGAHQGRGGNWGGGGGVGYAEFDLVTFIFLKDSCL